MLRLVGALCEKGFVKQVGIGSPIKFLKPQMLSNVFVSGEKHYPSDNGYLCFTNNLDSQTPEMTSKKFSGPVMNSAAEMYYMSAGKYNVPIVFLGPNDMGASVAAQRLCVYVHFFSQQNAFMSPFPPTPKPVDIVSKKYKMPGVKVVVIVGGIALILLGFYQLYSWQPLSHTTDNNGGKNTIANPRTVEQIFDMIWKVTGLTGRIDDVEHMKVGSKTTVRLPPAAECPVPPLDKTDQEIEESKAKRRQDLKEARVREGVEEKKERGKPWEPLLDLPITRETPNPKVPPCRNCGIIGHCTRDCQEKRR